MMVTDVRPPVPPFTEETARAKVKAAENAWNSLDPDVVAKAYTEDSDWRNRDEFFTGREATSGARPLSARRAILGTSDWDRPDEANTRKE